MFKKIIMIVTIVFIVIGGIFGYGVYRLFNQFGPLVNKELSDSYYYSRDQKSIIYSPMGNWFELGKDQMVVDFDTFQVVARDYAKDEKKAYFKSKTINTPIDVASFTVNYDYVPMDKNHVYILNDHNYHIGMSKECFSILEDADPETYTLLSYDFAKDKNFVFRNNEKFHEVDRASFEIVNTYYCKDKHGVYCCYYNDSLQKIDINLTEIQVLSDLYIRDNHHVFVYKNPIGVDGVYDIIKIPFTDVDQFKLYDDPKIIKVDNAIYYKGVLLVGAHAPSFVEVQYGYTKDKNKVYFVGDVVLGADPKTFAYNKRTYTFYDKKHTYDAGKMIKGKK